MCAWKYTLLYQKVDAGDGYVEVCMTMPPHHDCCLLDVFKIMITVDCGEGETFKVTDVTVVMCEGNIK